MPSSTKYLLLLLAVLSCFVSSSPSYCVSDFDRLLIVIDRYIGDRYSRE